jgi:FkbM family methyltransferase
MIQRIKDFLVSLGPRNTIVRLALKLHCRRNGFVLTFPNASISIRRGSREVVLAEKDFYLVPIALEIFDQMFEDTEPQSRGTLEVLDFSARAAHRYKKRGITLTFPGIPEDDSIAGYTQWYTPQPGDLVFDIGAHAGFTAIMFARMVGPSGRVVAFEPDASSLACLEKNIGDQRISNVTIVPKAIDAKTGTAFFNADGTMGAGLVEHSIYGHTGQPTAVETLSLPDACGQFGVPQFVKMDIEGAELAVIRSAAEFLKAHRVHLAFDSYHRLKDGRYTWMLLEPMLRSLGYEVESSTDFGQMFTWAKPRSQQ